MLQDTRILSRHGAYASLWQRQAVVFRDRSVVQLHQVRHLGVDHTYLRAFLHQNEHWCVFDLRSINRSFADDFPALPVRDHAGTVLFTLREQFPGGLAAFAAAAFKGFSCVWSETGIEPLMIEGEHEMHRIMFEPELRAAA